MRKATSASKTFKQEQLLAKRDAWLPEIDPASLFHRLFDLIPSVYFFAKNADGELMFLSRNNRDLCQLPSENAVVGLTDFDLNPAHMARSYARDDTRILRTGKPLVNRLELWRDLMGMPDWFVVNKMPIWSRSGKIIGIMGFSQKLESSAALHQPSSNVAKAVTYIRKNFSESISIHSLARFASLSSRQLERRFKATFGLGPQQFLIKTRLLAGCQALRETEHTIAEIAQSCGFCDQSAFARHLRQHLGVTASEFRKRNRAL
jgi:AraC-like DNA-binding protein